MKPIIDIDDITPGEMLAYHLCYVVEDDDANVDWDDPNAMIEYELVFTDNMRTQWGDDWDDAPYEHNAGYPYNYENKLISINVKLPATLDVHTPRSIGYGNSPFSVNMINARAIPWLWIGQIKDRSYDYYNSVAIFGGDSIDTVLKELEKL